MLCCNIYLVRFVNIKKKNNLDLKKHKSQRIDWKDLESETAKGMFYSAETWIALVFETGGKFVRLGHDFTTRVVTSAFLPSFYCVLVYSLGKSVKNLIGLHRSNFSSAKASNTFFYNSPFDFIKNYITSHVWNAIIN